MKRNLHLSCPVRWASLVDDEVVGEGFNDKFNPDSGNRMPDSGSVRYFKLL